MEDLLRIAVVLGTARDGRSSEKVTNKIIEELNKREGVVVEYVDVKDFLFGKTIPSWEESAEAGPWRDSVSKADAFVFVVPEYNRSYPGEFKILLDSAYKQYQKKPVLVVGVSSGAFAGTRMFGHIQPILTELGLAILKPVLISHVDEVFDEKEEGGEKERILKLLGEGLTTLSSYAAALRTVRENS